jgi:hypothetical protein
MKPCEMCGESADFEVRTVIVSISKEGEKALNGKKTCDSDVSSMCVGCLVRVGLTVMKDFPKEKLSS